MIFLLSISFYLQAPFLISLLVGAVVMFSLYGAYRFGKSSGEDSIQLISKLDDDDGSNSYIPLNDNVGNGV